MKTLREEILQYAGIVNENITPKQAGDFIINHYNRKYTNDEIIKGLNNLIEKGWVKINKDDKNKTIQLTLYPMNWHGGDGVSIDDAAVIGKPVKEAELIKSIIHSWAKIILEKYREMYKEYKVEVTNRKLEE